MAERNDQIPPRTIASRKEIDRLKLDRKNDPPAPEHNHPAPSWLNNSDDTERRKMRMRERRIRYLENRLDGAKQKMERGWDQNH